MGPAAPVAAARAPTAGPGCRPAKPASRRRLPAAAWGPQPWWRCAVLRLNKWNQHQQQARLPALRQLTPGPACATVPLCHPQAKLAKLRRELLEPSGGGGGGAGAGFDVQKGAAAAAAGDGGGAAGGVWGLNSAAAWLGWLGWLGGQLLPAAAAGACVAGGTSKVRRRCCLSAGGGQALRGRGCGGSPAGGCGWWQGDAGAAGPSPAAESWPDTPRPTPPASPRPTPLPPAA